MSPTWAVVGVVAVWWLGTGAVFLAARGTQSARRWSFVAGSLLLGGVVVSLAPAVSMRTDAGGVVQGLLVGFATWAWMELSFYTGYVTGPSTREPPPGSGFVTRFRHALEACLWHELAIVGGLALLLLLSPGPNRWAALQFSVFWGLHEVARINVLIGVPHPFRELLPRHLSHLQPYLEPRRAGVWLHGSLAILVAVTAAATALALGGSDSGRIGWTALSVLLGLGVLELGVLLFPVPLARLWQWFGMEVAPEALAPR